MLHPCDGQAICKPETAPPPTGLEKILRLLAVVLNEGKEVRHGRKES